MTTPKTTAAQLKELLATHHSKDVWIPECKSGQTMGRGEGDALRKLDGWAMSRSWSPLTTYGYEIKVDRQDFRRDKKWTEYLPLCHEFAFVCPAGLISPFEIPEGIGLFWASVNGSRLYRKKDAVRREPDPRALNELMSYVLMSRSQIVADMWQANATPAGDRLELIRKEVAEAERKRDLAVCVNAHVRARVKDQAWRMVELQKKVDDADRLASRLLRLGITWDASDRWTLPYVEREIDQLAGLLPDELKRTLLSAQEKLTKAIAAVEEIEQRTKKVAEK